MVPSVRLYCARGTFHSCLERLILTEPTIFALPPQLLPENLTRTAYALRSQIAKMLERIYLYDGDISSTRL